MRTLISTALIAVMVFAGSVSAQTATSTAGYEVTAINEVGVSGSPADMIIDAASELNGVTDASTTWSVTTNQSDAKVTGEIDAAMPADVTLKVELAAPTGATSQGSVALSTTAANLVTGITELEATGLGVTYTLSALPTAGVVAAGTRTVTYTITDGV